MNRAAVHEAGHVVAHLARGYVPRYAEIHDDGSGRTGSAEFADDEDSRAISAVAGCAAERLLLGRDFGMSTNDCRELEDAADASGVDLGEMHERATAEATRIVQTRRDAVLAVAAALERERYLSQLSLMRLCESVESLQPFVGLFRKRSA